MYASLTRLCASWVKLAKMGQTAVFDPIYSWVASEHPGLDISNDFLRRHQFLCAFLKILIGQQFPTIHLIRISAVAGQYLH